MTCYFCQKNKKEVDFKNTKTLKKFIDETYKIKNRRKTGLCAQHQKKLSKAIKKARELGVLPYTPK